MHMHDVHFDARKPMPSIGGGKAVDQGPLLIMASFVGRTGVCSWCDASRDCGKDRTAIGRPTERYSSYRPAHNNL